MRISNNIVIFVVLDSIIYLLFILLGKEYVINFYSGIY